jgi:fructokinase
MKKVYAIGESLIDIIFSNGDVKAAKAGGSMLNSAISLGRAGQSVIFLSEFGQDQGGRFISDFLERNNVRTDLIHRYKDGKTPIALAFLNEKGDASYDFYKPYPPKRLQLDVPKFTTNDIFLFGSFFGIDPSIRETLLSIVKSARDHGALIVYDPNFRKPHAHELEKLRPFILENIELASIVKASNEDMELIFGESDPRNLRKIKQLSDKPLFITQGSSGALLDTTGYSCFYPARKIDVVSTIGAGDNFNAGLIYGLINQDVNHNNIIALNPEQWATIAGYAMGFAANVCLSYDNYISQEYASQLP